MNFELFLIIITALYCLQGALFLYGLRNKKDAVSSVSPPALPVVTVVVAARNEEQHLPACLDLLVRQTYAVDRYEVIVINDQSTDATQRIITDYAAQYPHLRLLNAAPDSVMKGKANALSQGIEQAKGELILITDADCLVPPAWIEETVKRYNGRVGLVGGITVQEASTPFEGMQSLDWAFVLGVAAATAALGKPTGSIGNNLSFRKKAYDEVGGYKNLKFSVTEDYTLVKAIIDTGTWEYLYPIDKNLTVVSKPCHDWKTLIRQRHRWGKGGLDMRFEGFILMAITFLMHIAPFVMLYWGSMVLASAALMIKCTMDYIFLNRILKQIDRLDLLKWFYWFELYFMVYVVALPFLVFFGGKVKWKGRSF